MIAAFIVALVLALLGFGFVFLGWVVGTRPSAGTSGITAGLLSVIGGCVLLAAAVVAACVGIFLGLG